jgi:hypothetical protein
MEVAARYLLYSPDFFMGYRNLLVSLLATSLHLCLPAAGRAQSADPVKQAIAVRMTSESLRVDGRLDDQIWSRAQPVVDFVQKEPVEGDAPTDAMEVRFAYDDDALYIGARMYAVNTRDIQAPLGRRDSTDQAEHVMVSFDTFRDRRTAVTFGVTASGVRIDRYHPGDREDTYDAGFDPVWQAHTSREGDSWTAELWIPFSQLRFNPQEEQIWGLNIRRFRPSLDEEDYWVLIPRTESYWSSRFGELRGISGIEPRRRIELLPYVAGAATHNANRDPRNPFDDGRNLEGRTGADVKIGIGPNLTLDATVNPDFGQVEADPAEVNLTAFETRFSEKRPFFLEGSQLFDIWHPNFYYSRRIGARPAGAAGASGDFVDYPAASTILAAGKLVGRLPSKTSIGVLSAVTDSESASFSTPGSSIVNSVPVGPRAYWGVGRVQQEFGRLGSTVGLLVDGVHRDFAENDPLASRLTRNAMAIAGDTLLRMKDGEYQFHWAGGASFLNGSAASVERFQRASSHYAQRPDRDYARFDPTRTSLSGFSMQGRFERVSGRHWLWNVQTKMDTPFFETNDFASFNSADGIMPTGSITYRETRPGKVLRAYSIAMNQTWEWNFGGNRQNAQIRPSVNVTWANFWTSSLSFSRNLRTNDANLTRGGPLMAKPRAWSTTASLGNRSSAETRWSGSVTIGGNEDGGSTHRLSGSFAFRPGPRWQFIAGPFYERLTDPQQYVATITGGGRAETFNNRYVFAYIDRSTVSTEFRLGLTIRPDMNLDVYAEPFAASGRYYDFGELMAPSTRTRITYGAAPGTGLTTLADGTRDVTIGSSRFPIRTQDFNTLSFRSNVVLRWEWRPGSTLYLVWQQDRSSQEVLGARVDAGDMLRSLSAPGSNFFIVKTSFWLPIN